MTIEFNIARGKLQYLFKHAVDFGVTGHWNNQTAEAFEEIIHNHITHRSLILKLPSKNWKFRFGIGSLGSEERRLSKVASRSL